jgi:hypothetical protein
MWARVHLVMLGVAGAVAISAVGHAFHWPNLVIGLVGGAWGYYLAVSNE